MIISASRRTDIPAFYAEWFVQRVRAGYCTVPNPFNAKQVSRVSLAPVDVDAIVFWTRNARPMLKHLSELDAFGFRMVFLYTLLDYPCWLERHTPPLSQAIASFHELSQLVGPDRVMWRYDPMVFSRSLDFDFHRRRFGEIAAALAGYTRRVVISVVDEYAKTRRRLAESNVEALIKKQTLANEAGFALLMHDCAAIAAESGMMVQSCAETLDLASYGIAPGACIDSEWLNRLFGLTLPSANDPSQRPRCGCEVSKDIGMYNTCLFGCQYCYATTSFTAARERYQRHATASPSLIPSVVDAA